MKINFIRILLIAGIFSIFGSLVFQTSALAKGEQWYWNGTETIQAQGGLFKQPVEFTSTNNNDATVAEYRADVSGQNISFKNEAGDTCTFSRIIIRVDKGADPNTVSVENVFYAGGTYCGAVEENDSNTISGGEVLNSIGDSAAESSLDRALEAERTKAIEDYVKKQCGDTPSPECRQQAEQSFNAQWTACMDKYAHLGADKKDEVIRCIEQYTGIDVDENGVTEGVIDIPEYEEEPDSCALEWIGYIICPVSRIMAKLTDKAFGAFEIFMKIEPLGRGTKGGDSLFYTWSAIRDAANALFVLAFLVIIYSQLTNAGISNYGIKKLLPRVVVAAILVNTSYYICVLAVDLSNVLGQSLKVIFESMAENLTAVSGQKDTWKGVVEEVLVPGGAVAAGGVAVAASATLYLSFAAMVPMLVGVLLSLMMAILLLTARYALIIILIIITPIAFVAFLLPNTQKWFSRWLSTFITLLMLYPVISLIYGVSTLASIIVMGSAGHDQTLLPIFGLAIQLLPLAMTPIIMKFGGGVLSRFGGKVQNNGLFKKANTSAQGYADRKREARDLKGLQHVGSKSRTGVRGMRDRSIQRRYKRTSLQDLRKGEMSRANAGYIADYTSGEAGSGGEKTSLLERAKAASKNRGMNADDPGQYTPKTKGEQYAETLGAGGGDGSSSRAIANALNIKATMHQKEVQADRMTIKNMSEDDQMNIAKGKGEHSESMRQAAIEIVSERKDSDMDKVMKTTSTMTSRQRHAAVNGVRKNNSGASPYYSSPTAINNILSGEVNESNFTEKVVAPSINEGRLSAASVAGAEGASAEEIHKAVSSEHVSDESAAQVRQVARDAATNKYSQEKIEPDARPHIESIRDGTPYRPPR